MTTPRAVALGDQLQAEIADRAAHLAYQALTVHACTLTDAELSAVDLGINAGACAAFVVLHEHGLL